jgi:two-component system cell cycle response regulator
MKIVVIDDSEFWRKVLQDLLNEHSVETATDGLDGYFKIQETYPDLVISDVVMPGLNGYLLCRIVKNDPDLKDIPFILMTGSSDSLDKFWGKYSGALDYIQKDSVDGIEKLKHYVDTLSGSVHRCHKELSKNFKSSFERALNDLLMNFAIENEIRKFFVHIDDMNYVVRGLFDLIKSMFEIEDAMIIIFEIDSMKIYTTFHDFEKRLSKIFENLKTPMTTSRSVQYLEGRDSLEPYELFWIFHQGKKENGAIYLSRNKEFSNHERETFSNVMIEVENLINVGINFDLYRRYSFMDKLTGLNNLRALNDYIDGLWKKNENFHFCMIDIDDFKKINDTYGHETGNEVLSGMGKMIRELSSKHSFFAARFGGEEISLISKNDNFADVIESLRKQIESTKFSSKDFHVTISAGIASRGMAGSYTEVIERADMALYEAKKSGKNKIIFSK